MENKVVLEMTNISKEFPGVKALNNVDFKLRSGEIHALMGENGAGKSTLIKVLTGVYEKDSGVVTLEGNPVLIKSPSHAQDLGISTVYQEVNLCPNLSVAENIFLGRAPHKGPAIDWKTMNIKATELLKSLDIDIDVALTVDSYSIALQQMVAIARAVDMDSKVLILDEPTSSLDDSEVEKLFRMMNHLKDKGVGIIFVTHFLEQVYAICDRITVLRNGSLVGEYPIKDLPRVELVNKMIGKEVDDLKEIKNLRKTKPSNDSIIEAETLCVEGSIKPFCLTINKGEVVGLAGLLGSGRSELARSIYGADKPTGGKLKVDSKDFQHKAEIDSMNMGMAYLPEDRKKEGIIADLSVRENIMIALQVKQGITKQFSKKQQEEFVDKYIDLLQIKTADRETPIKSLSGGNQQKVILARWLLTNPDFIILDEPTRGIDIGTKTEIQKLVLQLADEGKGVVFISSEIEEMIRTCSKMAVLRDGEKVDELCETQLTQGEIMRAIAGGDK